MLIALISEYQAKNTLLQSMKGIGKVAAASIISNLTELGYMTNKQAYALLGVAPINRESGRFTGQYQKLVVAGKQKKVALIACVRKMIVILNSMLRDGVMWQAPKV